MAGVEVDFKEVCEGIGLVVREDGKVVNLEELELTDEERCALTRLYEINKAARKEARNKDFHYIHITRERNSILSEELLEDGIKLNDSSIVICGGIIQKPDGGEFYTAKDFAKFYCLTPVDVVIIIREFRNTLHVYNLTSSDRTFLYTEHDPIEVVGLLKSVIFHYLDVRKYDILLQNKRQNENSDDNLIMSHEKQQKHEQHPLVDTFTPVNSARWEASCRAACKLLVEIMENPQATGIIKKDFLDMLGKQYAGSGTVHSKVDEIAWAALPASKKNGAGSPKKNPKNP